MSGVHVVPFPYCHRCPVSSGSDGKYCLTNCCRNPQDQLKQLIKQQTGADEVAAVIIEPMLAREYVVPTKEFLPDVEKFTREIGALLVADEVQTGMGRSGHYFASEYFGIVPDILVVAKGIANGIPLSAVVSRQEIMSRVKPGSVGGTYFGNVVACAAACAVIDELTNAEVGILNNVSARGEQFRTGLRSMVSRNPQFLIGDVRGIGLWNAIEFKDDAATVGAAASLVKEAYAQGLLLMNAGMYECIRFIPPLNITEEEIKIALNLLEKSLHNIFPKKKSARRDKKSCSRSSHAFFPHTAHFSYYSSIAIYIYIYAGLIYSLCIQYLPI